MSRHHKENFPVASLLLPPACRREVLALYAFARGADDLADDPHVPPAARMEALKALSQALANPALSAPDWAEPFITLCAQGRCSAADGQDLLQAFMQDQEILRCADWAQMLEYCRYSALPVGRAFLTLCGEEKADAQALYALCACLQILNHLQDIRGDYSALGRIYLPGNWLAEEGVEADALAGQQCSAGLRKVIDRVLVSLQPWMDTAQTLPASIQSPRLRMELRWVLAVMRQVHAKLETCDPLAGRVAPGHWGKARALMVALWPFQGIKRSSFYWPMRLTSGTEKQALLALYAFLRAIDDAADAPFGSEEALEAWRKECALLRQGCAETSQGRALLPFMEPFALDIDQLEAVVDGCLMDARGQMRSADTALLHLYCDRVAAAPGRLVLAILGQRGMWAQALAQALGQALQRTNILRDETADAAIGRRYFHPTLRAEFIRETGAYYQQAEALLRRMPAERRLMPVLLMRDMYLRLFLRFTKGTRTRSVHPALWLLYRRVLYGFCWPGMKKGAA